TTPAFLSIVTVEYTDGWSESYSLPLALLAGEAAERIWNQAPTSVVARIGGARKGLLVDGLQDDDTCERLLSLIERKGEAQMKRGLLRGQLTRALELPYTRQWSRNGHQDGGVLFLSDRYVLKLFRRIGPGPNPELEIARQLEQGGFTR